MTKPKRIVIVAGEASGDAHAGRMIAALKARRPDITVSGIGGDALRQAGAAIFTDFRELAVMGLVEVLKRYREIKAVFNELVERLQKEKPDLLILVDYPGFNLKLAKKAHKLGIPVLYYISPKVWAWRPGRIKTIRRYVDHMAVLFPFEETLYQDAGIAVTCVGHPLVDAVHSDLTVSQAKQHFELDPEHRVLGLFPGSRRSEVEALLPIMLQTAEKIKQRHFDLEVLLPLAPGLDMDFLQPMLRRSDLDIKVVSGDFYDVIRSCDAIVAASGTVTLEIALMGVPHLIVYRVAPMSYRILKHLVKIPYVGLCNIVTNDNIVTELLQDEVTVENLDHHLTPLLTDPQAKQRAEYIRQQVLTALGPAGGADNAAQLILDRLDAAHD
ncbi:lipid-A-disaccharide synthase [Methylophaga sp.]|uniref:lipid-A-disaccharide synthase n=1 Tax=Methylophaga sp. TaxID=2024840 RepID=UPI0013FE8FD4|nr:lipid-A-disaccharide synthase [Methylophaga sp.]MTI64122.1 lipid-A-disaccharide synthase [Methylophaga sp.]